MTVLALLPEPGVREAEREALITEAQATLDAGQVPSLSAVASALGTVADTATQLFRDDAAFVLESALLVGLPAAADVFGLAGEPGDVEDRVDLVSQLLFRTIGERARGLPFPVVEQVLRIVTNGGGPGEAGVVATVPLVDAAVQPLEGLIAPQAIRQLTQTLVVLVMAFAIPAARIPDELRRRRTAAEVSWACRALVRGALSTA